MAVESSNDHRTDSTRMPGWVRAVVFGLAGLLVLGALYLSAVRGDALLNDLSRLAAYCF
jgi:hypothetical protein